MTNNPKHLKRTGTRHTYYIRFYGDNKENNSVIESWSIRNTLNDMDTSTGLQQEIKDIETERGYKIFIDYWKELDVKPKPKPKELTPQEVYELENRDVDIKDEK
jgi:hypothetical protein